jgi:hypothetical protein
MDSELAGGADDVAEVLHGINYLLLMRICMKMCTKIIFDVVKLWLQPRLA